MCVASLILCKQRYEALTKGDGEYGQLHTPNTHQYSAVLFVFLVNFYIYLIYCIIYLQQMKYRVVSFIILVREKY